MHHISIVTKGQCGCETKFDYHNTNMQINLLREKERVGKSKVNYLTKKKAWYQMSLWCSMIVTMKYYLMLTPVSHVYQMDGLALSQVSLV